MTTTERRRGEQHAPAELERGVVHQLPLVSANNIPQELGWYRRPLGVNVPRAAVRGLEMRLEALLSPSGDHRR